MEGGEHIVALDQPEPLSHRVHFIFHQEHLDGADAPGSCSSVSLTTSQHPCDLEWEPTTVSTQMLTYVLPTLLPIPYLVPLASFLRPAPMGSAATDICGGTSVWLLA